MILILNKYSKIARKGPRKYYSLHREDFLLDEKYFEQHDTSYAQDKGEFKASLKNQTFRNYSLSPVFQSLSEGNSVEVYRSTLTVGESAHISWLEEEKIWVVANQNASVFFRTLKDLDKYNTAPKHLYSIALKIAKFWLGYLKGNVKDQKGFLKAISGKTL